MSERGCSPGALIFLHIPKTAGTTLSHIIARQFDPDEIFHIRNPDNPGGPEYSRFSGTAAELADLPAEKKARFRCVLGHVRYGVHEHLPGSCQYITVFRDPVQRVLSAHRQHAHHYIAKGTISVLEVPSLAEWLISHSKQVEDLQATYIVGRSPSRRKPAIAQLEQARENLRRNFAVIGTIERFDEFLVILRHKMGWRNVSYVARNRTRESTHGLSLGHTPKLMREIEEKNSFDEALHAEANRRLDEAIGQYGDAFKRDLRRFQRANRLHQLASRHGWLRRPWRMLKR